MSAIYKEPRWQEWAESWLTGRDRSHESADAIARSTRALSGDTSDMEELLARFEVTSWEDLHREMDAILQAHKSFTAAATDDAGSLSQISMTVAANVATAAAIIVGPMPAPMDISADDAIEEILESCCEGVSSVIALARGAKQSGGGY